MTGLQVVGQSGLGCEGVGAEATGRMVEFLGLTDAHQCETLRDVFGVVLARDERGHLGLQGG